LPLLKQLIKIDQNHLEKLIKTPLPNKKQLKMKNIQIEIKWAFIFSGVGFEGKII